METIETPTGDELIAHITESFHTGGSPFVVAMGLQVVHAETGFVRFTLPVTNQLTHGGGVLSGQAIMSCMDTGMVFVMMSLRPNDDINFTTVELKTAFERAVPADTPQVTFEARATKPGRSLVFGEIDLLLPDGKRAAAATTTYMWL
ncbi:MAG: PaaI family thioesterase [Ilumatobacteraceae bacterium]